MNMLVKPVSRIVKVPIRFKTFCFRDMALILVRGPGQLPEIETDLMEIETALLEIEATLPEIEIMSIKLENNHQSNAGLIVEVWQIIYLL